MIFNLKHDFYPQAKEFKSRTFRFYDPLNEKTFVESLFTLHLTMAPSDYFPAGNLATLSFPQTTNNNNQGKVTNRKTKIS